MGCCTSSTLPLQHHRAAHLDITNIIGKYVEAVDGTKDGAVYRCVNGEAFYVVRPGKGSIPGLSTKTIEKQVNLPQHHNIRVILREDLTIGGATHGDPIFQMHLEDGRQRTSGMDGRIDATVNFEQVVAEANVLLGASSHLSAGAASMTLTYKRPLGTVDLVDSNVSAVSDLYIHGISFGHRLKVNMKLASGDQQTAAGGGISAHARPDSVDASLYASGSTTTGPVVQSIQIISGNVQLPTAAMSTKPLTTIVSSLMSEMTKQMADPTTWEVLGVMVGGEQDEAKQRSPVQRHQSQKGFEKETKALDGKMSPDDVLTEAGIKDLALKTVYTKWFRKNGYDDAEKMSTLQLQQLIKDARMQPSHASRVYKFLHGTVVGRDPGVEELLEQLRDLVSETVLETIEDKGFTLEQFHDLIDVNNKLGELIPKQYERTAVMEQMKRHGFARTEKADCPARDDSKVSMPPQPGFCGMTLYFASLSEEDKLKVLGHAGVEGESRFGGKNTGKTTRFSKLTEEQKRDALSKFNGAAQTFASLAEEDKLKVLQCTGLPEVSAFTAKKNEGKTSFFAKLSEDQKRMALHKFQNQDVPEKARGATQVQMRATWMDRLKTQGEKYHQTSKKYARKGKKGEMCVCLVDGVITSEATVTDNTSYIVMDPETSSTVIMSGVDFERATNHENGTKITGRPKLETQGFLMYEYKKQIMALQLKSADIAEHFPGGCWELKNGTWVRTISAGDWVVTQIPTYDEVYCVPEDRMARVYVRQEQRMGDLAETQL